MRLFILLAAAAAAERVDRDADGVPDAAPEGACCECCYGCNPVWKSKFYGAFVLNRRVVLHAIDATPARWRGGAGSSPLDGARAAASSPRNDFVKNCRVHPTHWLISTQVQPRNQYMRTRRGDDARGHSRERLLRGLLSALLDPAGAPFFSLRVRRRIIHQRGRVRAQGGRAVEPVRLPPLFGRAAGLGHVRRRRRRRRR